MARTDEFVAVDGTELHYSAWGDPADPPVVCVHGLSRVGRDFDPLARALEADYRVLCPDLPGRGLSEWARVPEVRYPGRALADCCVAFCEALGLGRVRWVGTSMGGSLGIELAGGALADRVTHLVLNDIGPAAVDDEAARDGVDRIVEYLSHPPEYDRLTGLEDYYRETYATFSEMSDAEWRRFAATSPRRTDDGAFTPAYDPRAVEPLLTETPPIARWERFEAIDAPTYVLRGERSDILTDETFAAMRERRPDIETRVVDCGHAPALNVTDQVDPIREFLAR